MSLVTNWGYRLEEVNYLQDMLSVDEFNEFTADKYQNDKRTEQNLHAASDAIRNYCGWHVFPSLACSLNTTLHNNRVTRVKSGLQIQLPATYVTEVSSVKIAGAECPVFVIEPNGLLNVYEVSLAGCKEYTTVEVEYTAGIPDSLMGSIRELVAHRVTHALASSAGVQSETAGGVSITYSANWINTSRSTALADDNKEVLAPYKVKGVF